MFMNRGRIGIDGQILYDKAKVGACQPGTLLQIRLALIAMRSRTL